MYKYFLVIVAVCGVWAQGEVDTLKAVADSSEVFTPDPEKIAQDRIKMMRAFILPDTSGEESLSAYPLSLDEAIQRLIEHNKEVQRAKLEYLIGEKRFLAAFGIFEPYLSGTYEYSESERPDAVLIEMRETMRGGIEGVLPTGTRYGFHVTQKDIRFAQSTLEWPTVSSTVSVTQPILKDFLGNGPLTQIKVARAERQIAFNRFRSTLMAQCYALENTYWKLVYLQEKRRNAEKSVAVANQIVNDSRTLVASGIMSKLDAVEVSSEQAQRQMALSGIKIEHAGVIAELKQMIGYDQDPSLTHLKAVTPLLVNNEQLLIDTLPADFDSLLSLYQPELLTAEFTRIRSRIAVSQQVGKSLPELNLTGIVGVSGSNKEINQAVSQFYDSERNKRNWACAVEFKVPLGSGLSERNLLKAEKLNEKIAKLEEASLKREITAQTALTLERVHDLSRNLSSASVVVDYRTSLLQSEMVRLRAGLSSVRTIFEVEQELTKARESELEMRVQYQMTLSLYDRILGTTLSRRGLERTVNGKPVLVDELLRE